MMTDLSFQLSSRLHCVLLGLDVMLWVTPFSVVGDCNDFQFHISSLLLNIMCFE